MGQSWSTKDIPADMKGKNVIVTGANSGIGFNTALELGRAGANVLCLCRDKTRGEEAVANMKKDAPEANFELVLVDVSSQASIKAFAKDFLARNIPLDILINNAGIMMLPKRELSPDGFEMQLATNHLGPFALTGSLISALKQSSAPRVVAVASLAHWGGRFASKTDGEIDFTREEHYSPEIVYGDSKLMNLLFTHELATRYPDIKCVSAHPGGTATNLQKHRFGSLKFMMQSSAMGALPTLRAACDSTAKQRAYYGPYWSSFGAPVEAYKRPFAKDDAAAKRLWEASVKATGVNF